MEQNGSRLDRIEHLVESLAKSGAETDERLKSLGEELNSLGEKTDRRINALLEMIAQHETTQRLTNERVDDVFQGLELVVPALDRLAEAQRRTESNLNALISVVDGLVHRPPQ